MLWDLLLCCIVVSEKGVWCTQMELLLEAGETIGCPGTKGADDWELPLGAGICTALLCRSSKCPATEPSGRLFLVC